MSAAAALLLDVMNFSGVFCFVIVTTTGYSKEHILCQSMIMDALHSGTSQTAASQTLPVCVELLLL